jgi:hypothetical protein
MAAFGDNLTAGIGTTLGNTVQEQQFMDLSTHATDFDTGPLAGVGLASSFVFKESEASVMTFDLKNVFYPRARTNTVGLSSTYHLKRDNGLMGAVSLAVDYTMYDTLNFYQAVVGHQAKFAGFGSNLNLYVPFSGSETADVNFADITSDTTAGTAGEFYVTTEGATTYGSVAAEYEAMYGVDWTLSKRVQNVDLGATVSYHWSDDGIEDITAYTVGGEHTFSANMLTVGLAYQFTDGISTSDQAYKVFAKMPLTRSVFSRGLGLYGEKKPVSMYRPMPRNVGAVVQKNDYTCVVPTDYVTSTATTALITGVNTCVLTDT